MTIHREKRHREYSKRIFRLVLGAGLVPNILFLVFTLLYISHTTYRRQDIEYKESINEQTRQNIESVHSALEVKLSEVERYLTLLCTSRGYPEPFASGFSPDLRRDWQLIVEIDAFLSLVAEENENIEAISFYNLSTQIGFSSSEGLLQRPRYKPELIVGSYDYKNPPNFFWTRTNPVAEETEPLLSLVQTRRSLESRSLVGFLRIVPNADFVQQQLYRFPIGRIYQIVTDEHRSVIAHTFAEIELSETGIIISQHSRIDPELLAEQSGLTYSAFTSPINGWNYYLFYPALDWLRQYLIPMVVLFISANIIVLLVVYLAGLVTKDIYRPIRSIKAALQSEGTEHYPDLTAPDLQEILNEVEHLKEEYSDEKRVNQLLNQRMRVVYPEAQHTILNRILRNQHITPEIVNIARSMGLEENRTFCISLIYFYRTPSVEERGRISTLLERYLPNLVTSDWIGEDDSSLIAIQYIDIAGDDLPASTAHSLLKEAVLSDFGFRTSFLISAAYSGIGGVSLGYRSLQTARRRNFSSGPRLEVLAHTEAQPSSDLAWEKHHNEIVAAIRREDGSRFCEALDALQKAVETAGIDDTITIFRCKLLLNLIIAELHNKDSLGFDVIRSLESAMANFNTQFRFLGQFMTWLKNIYLTYRSDELDTVYSIHITRTLDYIKTSFDKNIGLDTIADALSLSVSYLSKLFKREVGTSFKAYLTEYRMHRAKGFLKMPELTVNDIARRCGYGNTNQFIRIFKKYEGLTPGDYRRTFILES